MKKISIARILIALGIVFGLCFLATAGLVISGSWISPLEKRDMLRALDEIDRVRSFHGEENDEFRHQVARAQDAVNVCKRHSFTEYDSRLLMVVVDELDSAVKEQKLWRLPDSDPRKQRILTVVNGMHQDTEKMIRGNIR